MTIARPSQALTLDDISNRDKRRASLHEAAHVVVAAVHDGRSLGAHIYETHTDDPFRKPIWCGQAHGINMIMYGISPATAVAGAVATMLDDDPEATEEDLLECLDESDISSTDWMWLPDDEDQLLSAVQQAVVLLRSQHDFFQWVFNELMTQEVITDGMVADYRGLNGN